MINKVMRDPLKMEVVNIVSGGADQDWALVELKAEGVCKNGTSAGASIAQARSLEKLDHR